ncbi:LGFP repeat-containing protein [Rothia aerolata]|uniref:LGFP repeat-containing protein n=1 Tax=Rothia aerolata TaxID=1812262 RepID=A0A917IVT8_9MICC|nr:hypothetical protein [Rothia aerolata]GGH65506.1 hypothetical protein GCM10007359_18810 [Rothia aerolata]
MRTNRFSKLTLLAATVATATLGTALLPAQAAEPTASLTPGTAISTKYEQHRASGESGFIGSPISDELCGVSGTGVTATGAVNPGSLECFQTFETGMITWNGLTEAHVLKGAIYQAWLANPAPLAAGGTVNTTQPITDEQPVAGGVQQFFAVANGGNGVYYWSAKTGAFFVDTGTAAGQYYVNNGGPATFGFPVSDVHTYNNGSSYLNTETGSITAHFDAQGQIVTGS